MISESDQAWIDRASQAPEAVKAVRRWLVIRAGVYGMTDRLRGTDAIVAHYDAVQGRYVHWDQYGLIPAEPAKPCSYCEVPAGQEHAPLCIHRLGDEREERERRG